MLHPPGCPVGQDRGFHACEPPCPTCTGDRGQGKEVGGREQRPASSCAAGQGAVEALRRGLDLGAVALFCSAGCTPGRCESLGGPSLQRAEEGREKEKGGVRCTEPGWKRETTGTKASP